MPQLTLRLNIGRRLSLKCLFLGHEDWIRRTSDRVYLECFECGRETQGWTTGRSHQSDRAANGRLQREPVNKRDDHSASASVRSSRRPSLRSDRSIGDHLPAQRIDYGPASSYAARNHAVSCRSTSAGAVSRTSTCQRFADVCSRFSTRGLRMSPADFSVRISDERRVATPANAVSRTRWIEVFFASSATGPSVRTTSRMRRYVASTDGSFFAKCDSTLMEADCN